MMRVTRVALAVGVLVSARFTTATAKPSAAWLADAYHEGRLDQTEKAARPPLASGRQGNLPALYEEKSWLQRGSLVAEGDNFYFRPVEHHYSAFPEARLKISRPMARFLHAMGVPKPASIELSTAEMTSQELADIGNDNSRVVQLVAHRYSKRNEITRNGHPLAARLFTDVDAMFDTFTLKVGLRDAATTDKTFYEEDRDLPATHSLLAYQLTDGSRTVAVDGESATALVKAGVPVEIQPSARHLKSVPELLDTMHLVWGQPVQTNVVIEPLADWMEASPKFQTTQKANAQRKSRALREGKPLTAGERASFASLVANFAASEVVAEEPSLAADHFEQFIGQQLPGMSLPHRKLLQRAKKLLKSQNTPMVGGRFKVTSGGLSVAMEPRAGDVIGDSQLHIQDGDVSLLLRGGELQTVRIQKGSKLVRYMEMQAREWGGQSATFITDTKWTKRGGSTRRFMQADDGTAREVPEFSPAAFGNGSKSGRLRPGKARAPLTKRNTVRRPAGK